MSLWLLCGKIAEGQSRVSREAGYKAIAKVPARDGGRSSDLLIEWCNSKGQVGDQGWFHGLSLRRWMVRVAIYYGEDGRGHLCKRREKSVRAGGAGWFRRGGDKLSLERWYGEQWEGRVKIPGKPRVYFWIMFKFEVFINPPSGDGKADRYGSELFSFTFWYVHCLFYNLDSKPLRVKNHV